MKRSRGKLLTRSRFSRDENRSSTRRHQTDDLHNLLNLGTLAYQSLAPDVSVRVFAAKVLSKPCKTGNSCFINGLSLIFTVSRVFGAMRLGSHHRSESAGCRETLDNSKKIRPTIR